MRQLFTDEELHGRVIRYGREFYPSQKAKRYLHPSPKVRESILAGQRDNKMAGSPHAYLRGSVGKFYEFLDCPAAKCIPNGPSISICGDSHFGNFGLVTSLDGTVSVLLRDFDHTDTGSPAWDLIRLALSVAWNSRVSEETRRRVIDELFKGYCNGLIAGSSRAHTLDRDVETILCEMPKALRQGWKTLAPKRTSNGCQTVRRNDKLLDVTSAELVELRHLVTTSRGLRSILAAPHLRSAQVQVRFLDAVFWLKGCGSMGGLRYLVLVELCDKKGDMIETCVLDIKEARSSAVPLIASSCRQPDDAYRIVVGATILAPILGERMIPGRVQGRPVVVRELMAHDMKLKINELPESGAAKAARYLATVLGEAHGRQMAPADREYWWKDLGQGRSFAAPQWLHVCIGDLIAVHEESYLQHRQSVEQRKHQRYVL